MSILLRPFANSGTLGRAFGAFWGAWGEQVACQASVAQLVELLSCKQGVMGSSPIASSICNSLAGRLLALVLGGSGLKRGAER